MKKLNLKITLKLLGPAIKVIIFYFEGIKVNLFILIFMRSLVSSTELPALKYHFWKGNIHMWT